MDIIVFTTVEVDQILHYGVPLIEISVQVVKEKIHRALVVPMEKVIKGILLQDVQVVVFVSTFRTQDVVHFGDMVIVLVGTTMVEGLVMRQQHFAQELHEDLIGDGFSAINIELIVLNLHIIVVVVVFENLMVDGERVYFIPQRSQLDFKDHVKGVSLVRRFDLFNVLLCIEDIVLFISVLKNAIRTDDMKKVNCVLVVIVKIIESTTRKRKFNNLELL